MWALTLSSATSPASEPAPQCRVSTEIDDRVWVEYAARIAEREVDPAAIVRRGSFEPEPGARAPFGPPRARETAFPSLWERLDRRKPPWPRRGQRRWDDACPGTTVPAFGDRSPRFSVDLALSSWRVLWKDEFVDLVPPAAPLEIPEVDGCDRFSGARFLHRVDGGWLVGTNFGEFGGGLWWFPDDDLARQLVEAEVDGIVTLGEHLLVAEGNGFIEFGALLEVHFQPNGPELAVFTELPGAPRALWARDDHLLVATSFGVVAVDDRGRTTILPCRGDDERNHRALEAYRRADNRYHDRLGDLVGGHVDLRRDEIEACFAAVPPSSSLPGAPRAHAPAAVVFQVSPTGEVLEAHPASFERGPPTVAECIASAARTWSFPGFDHDAGAFAYEFRQREPASD